ncbi:MAPEG family protein [Ottowia sp.]|uniref:MAPEG family protein n=1 Tax=Ottowia sp. TaxID=1898956 RepID=UPI002C80429A|nr:MAPEG family protein [Pseudomonadota bacterium]HOV20765.1 MAPEG family protein [Ottowia sp.]
MHPIHIVALLAVMQFFYFGAKVGRARAQYGIKAPAVTGHEMFERAYRVQMNTLEQLVGFLPALLIAGAYWPQAAVAAIGAVYLIGRALYRHQYMQDPARRATGFALTVLPTAILLLAGLVGAIAR